MYESTLGRVLETIHEGTLGKISRGIIGEISRQMGEFLEKLVKIFSKISEKNIKTVEEFLKQSLQVLKIDM